MKRSDCRREKKRNRQGEPSHAIGRPVFIATGICLMLLAGRVADGQDDSPAAANDVPWYMNNVLSTSLTTPGAAVHIPLDQTVAVRGKILNLDGSPAVGAEVWAASLFAEPPLRELVMTDARGNFTLNLKPLRGKSERWTIKAYQDSSRADIKGSQDWIKADNPVQPKPLVARLFPRDVMHCRVLASENGRPIANARMFMGDGRVLISDREGRITVGGIEQESHPVVLIAAGRHRRRLMFDNTRRPDGKLDIYLDRAGRVEGTVVDENDQPIAHAWIDVPGSGRALTLDGRCIVANEQGEFVWDGLRFDQVLRYMRAGAPGFQTTTEQKLVVHPGEPTRVVFRLTRDENVQSGTLQKSKRKAPKTAGQGSADNNATTLARRDLAGAVVGPNGKPIAKALVRWGATMYEDIDRQDRTDVKGQFTLPDIPDREGYVTVIAEALAPTFVHVTAGQTEIDVKLREGSSIGGRVENRSGDPIAGVRVVPVIASPDPSLCNPMWITQRDARTDKHGQFKIEGLPLGPVAFDFLHSGMTEKRGNRLQTGKHDHVIRLSSRGGFRGRVVDAAGNPVRDFRVTIDFPRERRPDDRTQGFSVVCRAIGNSYTDDDGRFSWGGEVAPGAVYRVTAFADGFGKSVIDRVVTSTVDLLDDAEEYLFRVPPPESLLLRVLDARDGQPIRGARVTMIDGQPSLDDQRFTWSSNEIGSPSRMTDQQGTASFERVASREGTITVQAPGFASHRFGWRNGERAFAVKLAPESVLVCNVRSTTGAALKNLYASVEGPGEAHHWDPAGQSEDGAFRFSALTAGRQVLTVRDERRELLSQSWELACGQTLRIDLTIDPKTGKVVSTKTDRSGDAIKSVDASVAPETD